MRAAASFLASHLTLQIICRSCGGAGHMARDCLKSRDPNSAENPQQQQFDNEYANLMAELGEGPKDNSGVPPPAANVPPWRDPANWSLAFYSDCSPRRWLTCKVYRHAPSLPQDRPQRGGYQNYSAAPPTQNYQQGYGGGGGGGSYGGSGGGGNQYGGGQRGYGY